MFYFRHSGHQIRCYRAAQIGAGDVKRLRHRGPDWSGVYSSDKAILVHERLAIVDPGNGAQPLYNPERTHVLAVNGEIYNHKELEKNLKVDFQFQTHSDCEVLLALYKEKGPAFWTISTASSPSSSMTPSRMPT